MRAWAVIETGKPLKEIELPTPEPKGAEVLLDGEFIGPVAVCKKKDGGGIVWAARGGRKDECALVVGG